MPKEKNATNWVLGGALLLIGLFVIIALILVRSEALEPTVQVAVDNAAPTIATSTIAICDDDSIATTTTAMTTCQGNDASGSLDLTAGTTEDFTIVFEVEDDNGADDLNSPGSAVFFDSNFQSSSCSQDDNDCYTGLTCTKASDATGTSAWYKCPLTLQYYANPGAVWTTDVTVGDGTATANESVGNEGVQQLVSATFPSINYGSQALGFTSSAGDNQEISHTNNGNVNTDFDIVLQSDLNCELGSIPDENIKADTSDVGFASATYTATTATASTFDLNLPQLTIDGGTSTKASFWNIDIPDSGVSGSCNATMTATALAG